MFVLLVYDVGKIKELVTDWLYFQPKRRCLPPTPALVIQRPEELHGLDRIDSTPMNSRKKNKNRHQRHIHRVVSRIVF